MFPDDTLNASYASTKMEFILWDKNFVLLYFVIHAAFGVL